MILKKLLSSLSQVNRINSSKTLGPRGLNRRLSTVSTSTQINNRRNNSITATAYNPKETGDRKVRWFNIELNLMRDGCLKIVNGWINPVLLSTTSSNEYHNNNIEVDEYIKKIEILSSSKNNPSSIKKFVDKTKNKTTRFVNKKLDNDTALLYEPLDNGIFSLWGSTNKYLEPIHEDKTKFDNSNSIDNIVVANKDEEQQRRAKILYKFYD